MFARFDENPAMTLRVIKETKRYGRMDGRMDRRTDNVKTVYPLQTKFAGGINTGTNYYYLLPYPTWQSPYFPTIFFICTKTAMQHLES